MVGGGGLICLAAIYLPSFLLLIAALPFWDALRHRAGVQSALKGINATVVGILLGALYTPVAASAIFAPAEFGLGVLAFLLLVFWRTPPWLVVILGAAWATALATVVLRLFCRDKSRSTSAFHPITLTFPRN